jgi:F-type H+-transporting ATPase subunit b
MPQLDVATFPPQLIWLAITFIVLYVLMATLGLPSIERTLKARRTRIDDDLEKTRQMKAEAEAVISAYERALAEARQQAQLTLKETTDRLNAEAAQRQRQTAEQLAGETAAAGSQARRQRQSGALPRPRRRHSPMSARWLSRWR